MSENILLLHPGAMGSSIGAALRSKGHNVLWVKDGRSAATVERARGAGLTTVDNLKAAIDDADHVLSVCPPHAAVKVAKEVNAVGFDGTFVDANAISPATAKDVAEIVGGGFVDGGIIGPPAWQAGVMRMYLSGADASRVAAWFDGTLVDARVIESSASALKMCYAAYTKGSTALLLAVRALAASEGVTDALLAEWEISQRGLGERSAADAATAGQKAWRFEGEMLEIAATFSHAELPTGFHEAAAEIYRRMRGLKQLDQIDVEQVVETLRGR